MKRLIILIGRLCKYVAPTKYIFKVPQIGRFMALIGVFRRCVESPLKGLYPQSDRSLEIADINASKGFVGLWVHLTFAIFAIDVKRQLKLLEMACDQVQTCLIFPLRWAVFFFTTCLTFQSKSLFSMKK